MMNLNITLIVGGILFFCFFMWRWKWQNMWRKLNIQTKYLRSKGANMHTQAIGQENQELRTLVSLLQEALGKTFSLHEAEIAKLKRIAAGHAKDHYTASLPLLFTAGHWHKLAELHSGECATCNRFASWCEGQARLAGQPQALTVAEVINDHLQRFYAELELAGVKGLQQAWHLLEEHAEGGENLALNYLRKLRSLMIAYMESRHSFHTKAKETREDLAGLLP